MKAMSAKFREMGGEVYVEAEKAADHIKTGDKALG